MGAVRRVARRAVRQSAGADPLPPARSELLRLGTYGAHLDRVIDGICVSAAVLLGYYAAVSMVLNVFNVPLPEGATPYFAEPK